MSKPQHTVPNGLKFVFGGMAGMMGTMVVHPLDLIKNRLQLAGPSKEYKSGYHAFRSIVANEGALALYDGISAGLLRQATYTTARLGIFTYITEQLTAQSGGTPPGFATKAAVGMFAGICGSFVGNPADVALIRMTADGKLPKNERRNYKNVFNALARIIREEGVPTLWKGAIPTMVRAMVTNGAQLGTYSQAKQMLHAQLQLADGILLHFMASMVSGLVTATASLPVDIVKTRIQNAKGGVTGGPVAVLMNIVRAEGVSALWTGFLPYYLKLGPHTVLTFVFLEQLNRLYLRSSSD
ncbi:hypothetical protein NQ317_003144 [Molorchus minor]|uniref:Mitochondrial 2-oxoglutarate/malate carrier protein n=1 Tax=Molorchus minor TaxID=1323400 RepID=A0ABQ9JZK8_9CUCU|nr:hypothetical protein NQ317_003144 [Molorchus minor]